jgi:hypothetical protein
VIVLALVTAAPAVHAQEDPRPRQALEACAAGDVGRGIALLAALYAESKDVGYIFNQGRCYQQNGQLEPAAQRFREYLRVGVNEPAGDRERARGFVQEIEETLARQQTAASSGGDRHRRALRITGFALGAVGVAAVGAGAVLGLKVRSTENAVEKEFKNPETIVTDSGRLKQRLADGGRYETWQWVSYGVGVAALAGGATALVISGAASSPTGSAGREQARLRVAPLVSAQVVGALARVAF